MPKSNIFTPEQSEQIRKIIVGTSTRKTQPGQRRALDALKDICAEVEPVVEQEEKS